MAKRAAETSLWDSHKDTIHELYMAREQPLKDVMAVLETQHGFKRTKAQYERNFQRWSWRRKLKANEWQAIERQIGKRRAENRPVTDLEIQGLHMPREKIQRGIARHRFQTTLESIEQALRIRQNPADSHLVRVSSPTLGTIELDLQHRLNEAMQRAPWAAVQKLMEAKFHERRAIPLHSKEASVVRSESELRVNVESGYTWENDDEEHGHDFFRWVDDLTFETFINGEKVTMEESKQRYRFINLGEKHPLPFVPYFKHGKHSFDAGIGIMSDLTSRATQLQFLQLAVALLSNNRTDGTIEHILVDLCSIPRNMAFIRRFLKERLLSTQSFADQLLLPAVEREHSSLVKALLGGGANPLALRRRKDLPTSQTTLAAYITLRTDAGGRMRHAWQQNTEDSPLSLAVQVNNESILRALVQHLNNTPFQGTISSAVHPETSRLGLELAILKAVGRNEASMLRLILDGGTNQSVLKAMISKVAPKMLEYAVTMHHFESVEILLSYIGHSGELDRKALGMALTAAARRGQLLLVQQLTKRGARINPKSPAGKIVDEEIPLSLAVKGEHTDVVRFLLEKGAYPNLYSWQSATPLQIAASYNNLEIAKILLEAGADPNVSAPPNGYDVSANRSALRTALLHSSVEFFFMLVRYGADVKEPMAAHDTHSILTLALMGNNDDIINLLLEKDVWPSANTHDRSFQACVQFHGLDLLEKFIQHGAEMDDPGALCAAIDKDDPKTVDYLLHHMMKAHDSLPVSYGASGLAFAAQSANLEMIKVFLRHKVKPFEPVPATTYKLGKFESQDWHGQQRYLLEGTTALCEAVSVPQNAPNSRDDQNRCLQLLLSESESGGLEASERQRFQSAINNALLAAANVNDVSIAGMLMREGASCYAESTQRFNKSPLEATIFSHNSINMVRLFLQDGHGNEVHPDVRKRALGHALTAAVIARPPSYNIIKLLLEHGADVNFSDCAALRHAIKRDFTQLVKFLLVSGAAVQNIKDSAYMETYLQFPAEKGNIELVKALVDAGADAYNISMALQEAVEKSNTDMTKFLLENGADVNARPRMGTSNATAVQLAAKTGNFDIMKMLLEAGGNVNAPRARVCGRTALEVAAEQGLLDMTRFLLEMGADVRGKENKVYRRSVYRAWDEGHAVVAEMIQDFKKARYGLADCVSTEVILDSMNQLALEIEPYEETSSEPACYEIVGPTDQVVL